MVIGPHDRDEHVADRIAQPPRPQLKQRRISRHRRWPQLQHEHGDQHGEDPVGEEGQTVGCGLRRHSLTLPSITQHDWIPKTTTGKPMQIPVGWPSWLNSKRKGPPQRSGPSLFYLAQSSTLSEPFSPA